MEKYIWELYTASQLSVIVASHSVVFAIILLWIAQNVGSFLLAVFALVVSSVFIVASLFLGVPDLSLIISGEAAFTEMKVNQIIDIISIPGSITLWGFCAYFSGKYRERKINGY